VDNFSIYAHTSLCVVNIFKLWIKALNQQFFNFIHMLTTFITFTILFLSNIHT